MHHHRKPRNDSRAPVRRDPCSTLHNNPISLLCDITATSSIPHGVLRLPCQVPILMLITGFYAALLGLLFVALSVRTLRLRRVLGIAVGDAGNPKMLRAMRVHSNFAEYIPFALFLIYLSETQGVNRLLVHALCLALLVGRLSHAYGVSQLNENYRFRVAGMAMTFTPIIITSTYLLLA